MAQKWTGIWQRNIKSIEFAAGNRLLEGPNKTRNGKSWHKIFRNNGCKKFCQNCFDHKITVVNAISNAIFRNNWVTKNDTIDSHIISTTRTKF